MFGRKKPPPFEPRVILDNDTRGVGIMVEIAPGLYRERRRRLVTNDPHIKGMLTNDEPPIVLTSFSLAPAE